MVINSGVYLRGKTRPQVHYRLIMLAASVVAATSIVGAAAAIMVILA
ncbi:hypothetical protein PSQ90_04155 [Devosia rhodophyticola]|uniref:Uncharacterized protein n=1 Tax=Devosia rhodophyticola TaxID=3026423 RepID=A0ABY7YZK9_9HYPH|nr:hypothetical protein [Devosia rhodophyticola]WDR06664.1 hypothetical protein PSQ90_04155 [Devosia rhodophyticola]